MSRLTIFYYATGVYFKYFQIFLDTLCYLNPEDEKSIICITSRDANIYNINNKGYKIYYMFVDTQPFPINILYKQYYISKAIKNYNISKENTDYAYFMQSNLFFTSPSCNIPKDKFNVFTNVNNCISIWPKITQSTWVESYNSTNYTTPSTYMSEEETFNWNAGYMFGGEINEFTKAVTWMTNAFLSDLRYEKFGAWHDELYINKYWYDHRNNEAVSHAVPRNLYVLNKNFNKFDNDIITNA